ncbi:uncharacterized protein [Palaemon carinicauda]|uniref:uncharacterized protein n=1 Tax=Palaemon carinicauda TaxID=392227 RepID=UPI0035B6A6B6
MASNDILAEQLKEPTEEGPFSDVGAHSVDAAHAHSGGGVLERAASPSPPLLSLHYYPPSASQATGTDFLALIRFLEESRLYEDERRRREVEARRRERQREEERRREQEAIRLREEDLRREEENARFTALIQTLAPIIHSHPGNHTPGTKVNSNSNQPALPPPQKATAQTPPPLKEDATFQMFREWRRRWDDYAVMVDLSKLPREKQMIQMRMCLTLETQRVLEHTLQISPSTDKSVDEVLDALQLHIKELRNEVLRRRELLSCKQMKGESFADFYVRLRRIAEEVDLCPGNADACEDTQLKMIILMVIRDAELVQKLIALDANSPLQDFVTTCRSYEAAKTVTSAIRGPPSQLCAVSAYRRSKKSSGKPPPSPKSSKLAVLCQFSSNSGASAVSNKQQDSRTNCRRLGSPSTISKTPKPICVLLSSGDVNSRIKMLPDTGADVTVIGQQHLDAMVISKSCLQPPPLNVTFTADGSPMSPALGILQATLTLGKRSCLARIQVHENVEVPLLSYGHCQELSKISPDFPKPILEVKHVNRCKELPISATTSPSAAKEYFLQEFKDVLVSKEDLKTAPLKPMAGPPMRIYLKDGAVPFAIHTPRQIPFAFKDQVKEDLNFMVAQGIIKPAGDDPSAWCHPLVVVAKNGTGVRITVDLTKLNSQVSRPAHPSPTPYTAIRSVDRKSRFFTTADALYGYWQMELAEEDRHLTTFITPYGRFIHCRGPMGFAATGDAFCLRGDMALQGVQNCVKVIDDLLLYDEDYVTHLHRIHEVVTRCRKFGITLNKDKFVVAAPSVNFCGYTLSGDGISADHQKDHDNGHLRLVQCGSRFLADAGTRYATIELEMLAVVWAMSKCRLYLAGLQHFTLMMDHRPLIPILNSYTLDALENSLLQCLKEKISPYIFTAVWRAGKLLCVPDALSRAPVSHPTQEDEILGASSAAHLRTVIAMNTVTLSDESSAQDADRILQDLCDAARTDPSYTRLLNCVTSGFPRNRYDLHNSLLPYWELRVDLYADGDLVLYGARVVVPVALRRRTLSHLHDSHRGVEATKRRARQSVFWPGIDSDIANTVGDCEAGQTLQPSQQQEPLLNDDNPTGPFEKQEDLLFYSVVSFHKNSYIYENYLKHLILDLEGERKDSKL